MAAESSEVYEVKVKLDNQRFAFIKVDFKDRDQLAEKDAEERFAGIPRYTSSWKVDYKDKSQALSIFQVFDPKSDQSEDYVHVLNILAVLFPPARTLQIYFEANNTFVKINNVTNGRVRTNFFVDHISNLFNNLSKEEETKLHDFELDRTVNNCLEEYFEHMNEGHGVYYFMARINMINRECKDLIDKANEHKCQPSLKVAFLNERATKPDTFFLDFAKFEYC